MKEGGGMILGREVGRRYKRSFHNWGINSHVYFWYFKGFHLHTTNITASIYKFGLFVWVFVCLYPINVKTAEPIGPKFFVGHLGTPGKVYEWSKFQIFVSIKIRSPLNFLGFWIFFLFYDGHKENRFKINLEDGREAPSKASILNMKHCLRQ